MATVLGEVLGEVPGCVLAIYAHPDDADVACGGALAYWADRGAEVHVLLCTDGDKGTTDPAVAPAELVRVRSEESTRAAGALGLHPPDRLRYPDGEVCEDDVLRKKLVERIRRVRPDIVLTHDPTAVFFGEDYFNHRDHRVVGFAVLDALSPASALPHYYPEAGPAHQVGTALLSGTLEPTVWVDVTAVIDRKVEAVSSHASQFTDGGAWAARAVRLRAEEEGRRAGLELAEGFRRLRLGG